MRRIDRASRDEGSSGPRVAPNWTVFGRGSTNAASCPINTESSEIGSMQIGVLGNTPGTTTLTMAYLNTEQYNQKLPLTQCFGLQRIRPP